MSYLVNLIGAASDDATEFHGYRVRIRDLALLIAEAVHRQGRLPREMGTPEGAAEIVRLLEGWDLVRTHDRERGGKWRDTTDNPAFLAAPAWLKGMLAGTERQDNRITLTTGVSAARGTTRREGETVYVSSLVPGFHAMRDLPVDIGATIGLLSDEIARQASTLPPGSTVPVVTKSTRYDWNRIYDVDLGTMAGLPHRATLSLDGGQHQSTSDVGEAVSRIIAIVHERADLASEAKRAVEAIANDIAKRIRDQPSMQMGDAMVTSAKRHENGVLRVDAEFAITHPDHAHREAVSHIQTNATMISGSSKWDVWNPFLGKIVTNVRRTLSSGDAMMIDPVIAATLDRMPRERRARLLRGILARPGEPAGHMALKDTPFQRLRVLNGVIGGTVELAPGITWVDGSLRVKTSHFTFPETLVASGPGRSIRAILEHDMIPDATIESVRKVDAAYYFVTDLKARPFVQAD